MCIRDRNLTKLKIDDWREKSINIVNEWKAELNKLRNSDSTPIRPERLMKELSEVIQEDSIVA